MLGSMSGPTRSETKLTIDAAAKSERDVVTTAEGPREQGLIVTAKRRDVPVAASG
jgi:hypothetical protein